MPNAIVSWESIFLFLSVMLAYFVKAITGFGNTLVMGSLFSFVIPNSLTTPVDLLMSIPTNGYMAWRERKGIHFKAAIPLAALMILGLLPGAYFLKIGSDWLLKAVFGLVIVGMALQIAFKQPGSQKKKHNPALLVIIGLISGILAGIFGIGALVAVYFSKATDNKQQFRSNTCFVFFIENIVRVALYWGTGILNKQVFLLTVLLFPSLIIGMVLGRKADKHIRPCLKNKYCTKDANYVN